MALSRPIGWLRDQRGDAVGLATADPLFQDGETKPPATWPPTAPCLPPSRCSRRSRRPAWLNSKAANSNTAALIDPQRPSPAWRATVPDAMTQLDHRSAAHAMGQESKQGGL